ncbi:MAG: hypothetical protein ACP5P4_05310 [Steroidobacteraceae bacterium]
MQSTIEFFYHRAGFSYDPARESFIVGKLRGAIELAQAESWAKQHGAQYLWEADDPAECQDNKGNWETHPAVSCVLYLPCDDCTDNDIDRCTRKLCYHSRAALGGIIESEDYRERVDYRRVIEAELALEAMSE